MVATFASGFFIRFGDGDGLGDGEPDGYGNVMEDAIALIDYARDHNTQSSFDDLYGSQRSDVISSQVGEFLDAVQSMVEGKNAESANTVRFMADETNLTKKEMDDFLGLVSIALSNKNNANLPPAFIGKVPVVIRDGLKRFGVSLSENARHELSANDARHVRYSHGIERDGAYGITDGDVYSIPYIIANADAAYYRETDDGKKGVLYVFNNNDSTYYVEGISSDDVLSGKQMIKAPIGTIPSQYKNDVVKEKALTASPDDLKIPGTYVQDVTQARASKEMIPPIVGKSNPSANFSLDDDYMPLAEKYDAGIATDTEIAEMQRDVEEAAAANGYPTLAYHGTSSGGFNIFDYGRMRFGLFGEGFYFTEDPEIAASYTAKGRGDSPQVYKVFLRTGNEINMDEKGSLSAWSRACNESGYDIEPYIEERAVRAGGVDNLTNTDYFNALKDSMSDAGVYKYDAGDIVQGVLRSMGYDGITHQGGLRRGDGERLHTVHIVFNPEDI